MIETPLKDRPDLLHVVKLDLDHEIVGEDKNKLLLFEICCTRVCKRPVHAIVTGESSVGKSWLVNNVTERYFKDGLYRFSRVTQAALDRLGKDLAGKILVIQEMAGFDRAVESIRIMLSEGKLELLTTSTHERTGHIMNKSIEIKTTGTPVFISTTTRPAIESETETRVLNMSLDDSPDQTKRIIEFEAKKAMTPTVITADEPNPSIIAFLATLNDYYEIIIPYATKLAEFFPSITIQARRDFNKLLTLIAVNAFIHQHQRIRINPKPGIRMYLLASPLDFFYAWRIADETLTETALSISKRARKIINELRAKGEATVDEVAAAVGYSRSRCREILRALHEHGYVQATQDMVDRRRTIYSMQAKKTNIITIQEICQFLNSLTPNDTVSALFNIYESHLGKVPNEYQLTGYQQVVTIGGSDPIALPRDIEQSLYVDPITGDTFTLGDSNLVEHLVSKTHIFDQNNNAAADQTEQTPSPTNQSATIPRLSERIWHALGEGKEQLTEDQAIIRLISAGFREGERLWQRLKKQSLVYEPRAASGYWLPIPNLSVMLSDGTRNDTKVEVQ